MKIPHCVNLSWDKYIMTKIVEEMSQKKFFDIVKRMVFGVLFSQALWMKITLELKKCQKRKIRKSFASSSMQSFQY